MQDKIAVELSKYKMAEGLFGNTMTFKSRKTKSSRLVQSYNAKCFFHKLFNMWLTNIFFFHDCLYGSSAPNLQQLANKIVSLICSLSSCDRNSKIELASVFQYEFKTYYCLLTSLVTY